uniref:LY6/PLAUR domain containing 2 n=1 Tax=Crocodylus porosus TaxID=8502 RepID=A0A7M4FZQ3_CROPO
TYMYKSAGLGLLLPGCGGAAQSLSCYTCHEPITTSACTVIRNCSDNETMCKTTLYSREDVYPYLGDSTVTKMCAPRCVPSDVDGIGITRPVTCCNTDLCNSDGVASLTLIPTTPVRLT